MKRLVCTLIFLALPLGAAAADAPLSLLGPEILVNTTTRGAQTIPAAAGTPQGGSIVVWLGPDPAGSESLQVFGQRYGAGGRLGGELRISTGGNVISRPQVAAARDGGFVAAWIAQGVRARFYGPDGAPKGEPVLVSSTPSATDEDVAVNAAGEAMVLWTTAGTNGQIAGQLFDAQGQPLAVPFTLRSGMLLTSSEVSVAAAPDGGFLAAWSEKSPEPGDAVWARRFDTATRSWGAAFRLTAAEDTFHLAFTLAFRPDGSFLLVWTNSALPFPAYPEIWGLSFRADGAREGSTVRLLDHMSEDAAAVAVDRDGHALVVSDNNGAVDDLGPGVYATLFDRAWHPLNAPLRLHEARTTREAQPAVAVSAGGFLAVWSRGVRDPSVPAPSWTDGSSWGIFGHRLGDPRCAAGSEVLCLGGRFEARVDWKNPFTGQTGTGKALPLTGDTGSFWFFDAANLELMIKVLDGGAVNRHFWVFYGSLSNVEYTVTVTDTQTGTAKTYHNAPFQFASRADVEAFPSAAAASAPASAALAAGSKLSPAVPCAGSSQLLCLANGRFEARVSFVDPRTGATGQAQAVPLTGDTGTFWFFDPANLELMVKVLDAQGVNGHFWVFYGALSDVEYTITVNDTQTGATRTYHNAPHHLASGSDVTAF